MTCSTCGAALPDDATACPTCGASVGRDPGGATPGPAGTTSGSAGTAPRPATSTAHPSGHPAEVRNWALAAHLSAFVGSFFAVSFVGPLVVWLIRKEADEFSTRHAREALNFNLTLLALIVVGIIAAVPLAILTVGLILIPFALLAAVIGLGWIVLTIVAAVRAAEGREYRYPLTVRFVR